MFNLIAAATDRLLATAEKVTEESVREPSLLPGWSRAHVLSHLERQVPALERLLEWARTGVETPQYTNMADRAAEIEAGAARGAAELVENLRISTAHFAETIAALPKEAWPATIRPITGEICTAERILTIRLRELEVHNADLDLGYTFADIPDAALDHILTDVTDTLAQRPDMPDLVLQDTGRSDVRVFGSGGTVVSGTRADLLGWLTGRTGGTGLQPTQPGLPVLPRWI